MITGERKFKKLLEKEWILHGADRGLGCGSRHLRYCRIPVSYTHLDVYKRQALMIQKKTVPEKKAASLEQAEDGAGITAKTYSKNTAADYRWLVYAVLSAVFRCV